MSTQLQAQEDNVFPKNFIIAFKQYGHWLSGIISECSLDNVTFILETADHQFEQKVLCYTTALRYLKKEGRIVILERGHTLPSWAVGMRGDVAVRLDRGNINCRSAPYTCKTSEDGTSIDLRSNEQEYDLNKLGHRAGGHYQRWPLSYEHIHIKMCDISPDKEYEDSVNAKTAKDNFKIERSSARSRRCRTRRCRKRWEHPWVTVEWTNGKVVDIGQRLKLCCGFTRIYCKAIVPHEIVQLIAAMKGTDTDVLDDMKAASIGQKFVTPSIRILSLEWYLNIWPKTSSDECSTECAIEVELCCNGDPWRSYKAAKYVLSVFDKEGNKFPSYVSRTRYLNKNNSSFPPMY